MTSPHPLPEPADAPAPGAAPCDAQAALDAQRLASQAHALAAVARLTELTLELATALQANTLAQAHIADTLAEPVPEASTAAFDRVARCTRRTALTLNHLAQPPRPSRSASEHDAPGRTATRQRVLRAVEDAIQAEAGSDAQAERLRGEARERLEQLDRVEFVHDRASLSGARLSGASLRDGRVSVPALVADIVHDLGLGAPAGAFPWARRTPDDVAALAAWAAAPPGTPNESLPPRAPLRARGGRPEPKPDYARMSDAELLRIIDEPPPPDSG